jgi:hypothetical protein
MTDGSWIEKFRTRPLKGHALLAIGMMVWLAGALYCSGYEGLASGINNWPGSLIWSAVAVLPWLALFEWGKTESGRRLSLPWLIALFITVAIASVAAEVAVNLLQGKTPTTIPLLLLRRLPAIGVSLLLVLWSRAGQRAEEERVAAADLSALAPSIDWVAAADNYVELHISGRTIIRRMTMREAEHALARHGFVRIHRRFLVNRSRIADIAAGERRQSVRLAGGGELPIGRAFAPNLRHG